MDPNQTLWNIRAALREMDRTTSDRVWAEQADVLVEHITALDEWLCNGGFPPGDWIQVRRPA